MSYIVGVFVLAVSLWAAEAAAGPPVADHLQCYRVRDDFQPGGKLRLRTPQFKLNQGCSMFPDPFFCMPAMKDVVGVLNDQKPITPLPIKGTDPGDRMCYRIDCPPSNIQDVVITDQFGTRAVHDFVASFLCAPAVKGETFCGDGVRQGNEECDGQDAQACGTVKCRPDCTCECTTVCCYIESTVIAIAEAGCFEYTGPIALAALFASQCANGKSIPNGYAKGVVGEGQCVQGPNTGVQCVAGTTPNGIKIPPDTSCN